MDSILVDISRSPEKIINDFRALSGDMDKFIGSREDGLPIGNILIIKYIVLCYDRESHITLKYSNNWAERKKEAAVSAGMKTSNGWVDGAQELLFGRNPTLNKIIIKYLHLQFDKDFMMYAVLSEMLINATSELMDFKFDRPSDATKAKTNVEEVSRNLEELEKKIFSGGDVKSLAKALNEYVQKFTVKSLRPESIVSKLEKGEEIVDEKPYGDYQPSPQKFLNDG